MRRKGSVKDRIDAAFSHLVSTWPLDVRGPADDARARPRSRNGDDMGVLIYILLTVAVFALLGLLQKLVEGL